MPKELKSKSATSTTTRRAKAPVNIVSGMPAAAGLSESSAKLVTDGVVVLPVLTPDELMEFRTALNDATKAFPEYKKEYVADGALHAASNRFVGGSFGAFGNASSFHCAVVRRLRKIAYDAILPVLTTLVASPAFQALYPSLGSGVGGVGSVDAPSVFLEYLLDRLGVRRSGSGSGGTESWHRDTSPKARHDDAIFGGWLNLGPTDQYFVCQLGSHAATNWVARAAESDGDGDGTAQQARAAVGFEPIKDPTHRAVLDATGVHVHIPDGYVVLFFQDIAHAVCATTAATSSSSMSASASAKSKSKSKSATASSVALRRLPSVRLYIGARITKDEEPLGGRAALTQALTTLGPLKVKSNQDSEMYPKLYTVSSIDLLEQWTRDAFNSDEFPGLIETALVRTTGRTYDRMLKVCPSLTALGIRDRPDVLELCPPYSTAELAMHLPMPVPRMTLA